jgi:hypothetical protein
MVPLMQPGDAVQAEDGHEGQDDARGQGHSSPKKAVSNRMSANPHAREYWRAKLGGIFIFIAIATGGYYFVATRLETFPTGVAVIGIFFATLAELSLCACW